MDSETTTKFNWIDKELKEGIWRGERDMKEIKSYKIINERGEERESTDLKFKNSKNSFLIFF